MRRVEEIAQYIDMWAPFDTAEEFDNVGILLKSQNPVEKVLVALDLTEETYRQACEMGADLMVTHHPILFRPLKKMTYRDLVFQLTQKGISVISAHTNLDKAQGGVGDALAKALKLMDVQLLEGTEEMGRIGLLSEEMPADAFAEYVKTMLGCQAVRYTWVEKPIKKVALLGGGGDFCWEAALQAGADAYVTGEGKHHIFLQAQKEGFCYLDAGHFETEKWICPILARELQKAFPDLQIQVAKQESPYRFQ